MNTTSNHRLFNLADHLADISSLYLRMQCLSSYAWRIDTLIVAQCRALFKLLKLTPLAMTLDSDADLRNAITEGVWTEQLFGETGSSDRTPLMQNLWLLASMRLAAHEQAESATMLVPWSNGQPRQYKTPELEDLFVPTGSAEPKGESLLRMQMSAERNANKLATGKDAKELAKRFLDARLRIERANLASMQHNMAKQTDSLLAIYEYTMKSYPDELVASFDKLHIDVQRTLIDNAINSADRAVQTAESQPKELSFDDFCHLTVAADELKDQLKAVLASPKFNGGIVVRAVKAGPTQAESTTKKTEAQKAKIAEQLDPVKAAKAVVAKHKKTVAKRINLKSEAALWTPAHKVELPAKPTAISEAMTKSLADMPNDMPT